MPPMVVIVDYNLGNLFSVAKAFEMLGAAVKVSGEIADIERADRLVLPGIGAFNDGMTYLRAKGLDVALTNEVLKKRKPFLGICLGMQLLAPVGFEFGEHPGLGWIDGSARKLDAEKLGLKVPHIGWNDVAVVGDSVLFKEIKPNADFYFVHSYQLIPADQSLITATAQYGGTITAAIERGNIFATQFHPEKSQDNGLKLLENFLAWNP